MVYFAFDLEPISMFAEREYEHVSRVTHARAAGDTIAPRVTNRARTAQTADPHGRWRGIAHHQILYAG
jgi:hypothetical protein